MSRIPDSEIIIAGMDVLMTIAPSHFPLPSFRCGSIARVAPLVFVVAAALIVAWSSAAFAQRYHTQQYGEFEGLPGVTVYSIAQDARGRLWLSMRSGLCTYDGSAWIKQDMPDDGMPRTPLDILSSTSGRIYLVGGDAGPVVGILENGTWRVVAGDHHGAGPANLMSVSLVTRGGTDYLLAAWDDASMALWDGERWRHTGIEGDEAPSVIQSTAAWNGRFALATDRGIFLLDPRNERGEVSIDPIGPRRPVRVVAADPIVDRLWFVDDRAISTLVPDGDGEAMSIESVHPVDANTFARLNYRCVAAADLAGGLYFGSHNFIYYFHPTSGVLLLDADRGLISSGATDIFCDREGLVWIASMRGITKMFGPRFVSYTSNDGLYHDEVTSILRLRNGDTVLGHEGGLTILQAEEKKHIPFGRGPQLDRVLDLTEGADGDVWIAASLAGLARLQPDGDLTWYSLPGDEGQSVSAVCEDGEGRILVGTGNGLFAWSEAGIVRVPVPGSEDAPVFYVRRILRASDGSIYLGTGNAGVFHISAGVDRYVHPDSQGGNDIFALHELADGRIWTGTRSGIFELSGRSSLVRPDVPFEIDRPVFFIAGEYDDELWFGTSNGVRRWHRGRLDEYTRLDGMIGFDTNRDAAYVDAGGVLWVGMDRGLTLCQPDVQESLSEPRLTITEIEINGSRQEPGDLSVPHDQNDVVFRFEAISLRNEARLRVRSWLEGLESDWQVPRRLLSRELRYTSLPPGGYRLHLQVISHSGVASPIIRSDRLVVRQPYWRRAWFRSVCLLLTLGIMWGAVTYISQRKYTRLLESAVRRSTESLRASEEAIAAKKEQLAVTLASIQDGVIATDVRGKLILHNPAAERILGRSLEAESGGSLEELGDDFGPVLTDLVRSVVDSGEATTAEPLQLAIEERSVVASGAPIQGPGGDVAGVGLVLRDVTETKRLEAELAKTQKLEAVGILAGGIAHDFNNLLTGVLGHLSLIADEEAASARTRSSVEGALSATRQARSLTRQLLTFARGGAPIRRTTSIVDVVRESVLFALHGSSVQCVFEFGNDLPPVRIDAGQMSQVLQNLMLNACQAMPAGGIVTVRVMRTDESPLGRRCVRIEVEDDGHGIAADDIDRVFDPYFSTKDDGSGLGLAVSHSIVRKHDGVMTVESEGGRGAVFRVDLPAGEDSELESDGSSQEDGTVAVESDAADGPAASGRILVMDDEMLVREVVVAMLERLGYEPVGVADGDAAIEAYAKALEEERPFKAVILDLTIQGGMGGLEALERLIAIDPDVCAIVASGYSSSHALADHGGHGFVGCLEKPFVMEDLGKVLAEVETRAAAGS